MTSSESETSKDLEDWVPVALPIPDHWAYSNFEDALAPISTSKIKIAQKDYLADGAYPVIDQGQSFIGGYTDGDSKLIDEDRPIIVFGDHTKCFKFVVFPFAPGADGTKVLKPSDFLDGKFAYYACLSLKLPDRGYSRHYSFLKRSKFPVAPINEQRRIVAMIEELFSELDKGIESLSTAREQLKVYRQAVLDSAASGQLLVQRGHRTSPFSDDVIISLEKVVDELGQGWSPRCLNHPSPDDEVWGVIKTTAIQHLSFDESENKELPNHLEPRPHLSIKAGDILITRAGPRKRVGVACLVRACRPCLMLCDKAYRLQSNPKKVLPEYLEMLLNSPRVLDEIEKLKTGINDSGVNLTQARFLSLQIPVPNIADQNVTLEELERTLSKIENAKAQIEDALEREFTLRHSILKKAFSGQLLEQDSNDEPASVLLERIKVEKVEQEKNKKKNKKRKDAA